MPVLQLNDQQFPLSPRPTRIGAGTDADLTLPTDPALGVLAVIEPAGGNALVIRRAAPSALVRVNGVVLGAEPTPLMHGDKVEIGGLELRYADDAKGGATQFVNASELATLVGARRGGVARATTASGGRLISLVDGKEYLVPEVGVVIGRDASCDIVVGQNEVSRRHAEIAPGDGGYVVRDTSANGVFVNGERVQGSHRLMRSDVLRVGSEEFRFYADVLSTAMAAPTGARSSSADLALRADAFELVPVEPVAPLAMEPAAPEPAAVASEADMPDLELLPDLEPVAAPTPAAPPAGRATEPVARIFDSPPTAPSPRQTFSEAPPTAPAMPVAVPAEDTRPVLATLEILNEGPTKGTRVSLRTALVHVGRGAHNDVKLSDESVSETHAKLQRREDGWYLVDMESTNGSYVGGTRVTGERRIEGSPDLRFGGVKMRFQAAGGGEAEVESKGTRAIAAVERPRGTSSATAPVAETPASRGGVPAWVWILAAAALAVAAFFVLKGRA
jgi:pSer/pThr/pTyr-binding forkhead associated (FHA) protein